MRTGTTPLGLAALALALLIGAGPAGAHALYFSSTPAAGAILAQAPPGISVSLTEPVSPGSASIAVTDANNQRLDANGTRVVAQDAKVIATDLRPISPGLYTVKWVAVSATDGHVSSGTFSFALQDENGTVPAIPNNIDTGASSPVSPLEVALRFALFISMVIAVGGAAFLLFVWEPSGDELPEQQAAGHRQTGTRLLWVAGAGAAAYAAYAAALLFLSLMSVSGQDPGTAVRGSVYLQSLIARVGLGAAMAAFLLFLSLKRRRVASFAMPRGALAVGFLLGLSALAAGSGASHSAARNDTGVVGVTADFVHTTFVSTWVGGLIALIAAAPSLRGAKNALLARRALSAFSTLATTSVAGVISAGVALSLIEVSTLDNLLGTPFGLVVAAKILLVLPMLALGAHNKFKSVPALSDPQRVVASARRVLGNAKFEAALGAVVLVLAALLTALVPSTSVGVAAPPPAVLDEEQTKDNLRVELIIFPYPEAPAPNYTVSVELWEAGTSTAYLNGTNVTITFVLTNSTLGPQPITLEGPHGNHFFTTALVFTKPGVWRLDVLAQRTDGLDVRASFSVPLREAT